MRQSRTILPPHCMGLKSVPKLAPKPEVLRGDPNVWARHPRAMIDACEGKNRAELDRRLGLSMARVTQMLNRLTLA